jgi:hypothetical protein
MLKGEIKPKFFKISFYEATSWGFEPTETKYFKTYKDARRYAMRLVKYLKKLAKESGDYEFIEIENEKDEVVEAWRSEEGKVVHYSNGW